MVMRCVRQIERGHITGIRRPERRERGASRALVAAVVLVACVLALAACTDSPLGPRLDESPAAISTTYSGAPPPPGQAIPICPEPGDSPSPLPSLDLPSPTVAAGA
jgi:hypothetical protein